MLLTKKAVYFFCYDFKNDSVAPRVFENSMRIFDLKPIKIMIDGYPVMEYIDSKGNVFNFKNQSLMQY